MATVNPFEKSPPIPDPPNTRTDTKPVFLQKADAFNPALKAWADAFNNTIDNLNALVALLNEQLPYINTVADSDAAIRAAFNNLSSVNTVAAGIESVNTTATWAEQIRIVADNIAAVLGAKGYAEEAKKWALMAEAVTNVRPATPTMLGLVMPDGTTTLTDSSGKLSVPAYVGATAEQPGALGLVAPAAAGEQEKVFLGAGVWGVPSSVAEMFQNLGTVSGAKAINLSAGNIILATIGGATTFSFTGLVAGKANTILLKLTNAGSAAITWPSGVSWPGGQAPTLTASGLDVIVMETDDDGVSWVAVPNLDVKGAA